MTQLKDQINMAKLPAHVAIIMDGNGRWAKSHGGERSQGHVAGVDSVRAVIRAASDLGIKYVTLYAFSTENWSRPKNEVDLLLALIVDVLAGDTPELIQKNVKLGMIGDMERLPDDTRRSLQNSISATAHCTGLNLNLAISYSSRWEITEAARRIAADAKSGKIDVDLISETTVADYLATAGIPDPDLLIRTGGDQRISNFLLWQIAYSELYFTDIFWPEFDEESLYRAVVEYQSRERRFGMTSEQVAQNE